MKIILRNIIRCANNLLHEIEIKETITNKTLDYLFLLEDIEYLKKRVEKKRRGNR